MMTNEAYDDACRRIHRRVTFWWFLWVGIAVIVLGFVPRIVAIYKDYRAFKTQSIARELKLSEDRLLAQTTVLANQSTILANQAEIEKSIDESNASIQKEIVALRGDLEYLRTSAKEAGEFFDSPKLSEALEKLQD